MVNESRASKIESLSNALVNLTKCFIELREKNYVTSEISKNFEETINKIVEKIKTDNV